MSHISTRDSEAAIGSRRSSSAPTRTQVAKMPADTVSLAAVVSYCEAILDQAERARMINCELMHRNRNLFAIVTTLAAHTLKRAGIDAHIAATLTARITALARAQELISLDGRQSMSLERLVDRVLAPIMPARHRLAVQGSAIGIVGGQVTGLALVLHELGTNALKYGAWSGDLGRVTVSWWQTPFHIGISWHERGGPPAAVPDRSGFGSFLIETAIPGATVERIFDPAGLKVVLCVPLDQVADVL